MVDYIPGHAAGLTNSYTIGLLVAIWGIVVERIAKRASRGVSRSSCGSLEE